MTSLDKSVIVLILISLIQTGNWHRFKSSQSQNSYFYLIIVISCRSSVKD
ncbi:unnamed protein product [Spirodela intermedia]|uniref:Uncharacterized protein n=1 Tax=Spirodela intermedia TaxID=51605 RepID=A0ABN7EAA5_SPIIN|nr:unnamed protein product [Spirodela intermedia]